VNSTGGSVTIGNPVNATTGFTTIEGSSTVQAVTSLSVNSPDGILLDGTSGHFTGNSLNVTSGNAGLTDTPTVQNADLTAFSSVNIAGNTVVVANTTFGGTSSVNIGSNSGLVNVNNGIIAFQGNMINDNYGLTAITSSGQFTSGYSTSSGLHTYSIH
jgi:hypothetical protein